MWHSPAAPLETFPATRWRALAPLVALAAAAVAAHILVVAWRADRFVLLPIGSHQGPLPIASWLCTLAYALIALPIIQGLSPAAASSAMRRRSLQSSQKMSGVGREGRPDILARLVPLTLQLGLALHLTALLVWSLPLSEAGLERGGYRAYLYLAVALALTMLGWWSLHIIAHVCQYEDRAAQFLLPLPWLWVWALARLMWLGNAGLALAAIAAAGALAAALSPWPARLLLRWWHSPPWFLGTIATLGFALRLAAGLHLVAQLGSRFPVASADGDTYDRLATVLAQATVIQDPAAALWPSGYWTALGWLYRLVGVHNFRAAVLAQAAIGAVLVFLTFAIALRVYGATAARLSALSVALSGTLVFVSATLGTEAPFTFLLALAVWCLLPASGSALPPWRAALAGVALGWAELTRPQTLLVAGLILAWLMITEGAWRRGYPLWPSLRRAFSTPALLLASALVAISPLALPDLREHGHLTILTADGEKTLRKAPQGIRLKELGIDPFADPGSVLPGLVRHPGAITLTLARIWPGQFLQFAFGSWFGRFDPMLLDRLGPLAAALRLYGYGFGLFGLAVVLGSSTRRRDPAFWLLGIPVVATTLSTLLIAQGEVRFRVPIDPYLLMLVAFGLTSALRAAPDGSVGGAPTWRRPPVREAVPSAAPTGDDKGDS